MKTLGETCASFPVDCWKLELFHAGLNSVCFPWSSGAVAVSLCWPGIPWPGTGQTCLLHSILLGTSCCQSCSQGTALRGQAVLPGSDLCSRAVLALPGIALLCLLHTAVCSSLPELPASLQQAQIQKHIGMFSVLSYGAGEGIALLPVYLAFTSSEEGVSL